MDADGVLFPDAQHAWRQAIISAEPLFENDPILSEHLSRFIGLSGVGSGWYLRESLIEHREFFASLESTLVEMLPKGSDMPPSPECAAEISSLVDKLHRTELCLDLARNGELTSELFHKTEAYLRELKQGVHCLCDSLITEFSHSASASKFVEGVIDLRDLPQRMRLLVALRFECSDLKEIQPGDILSVDRHGRYLLLEGLGDGQADVVSFDVTRNRYERYHGDLRGLSPSQISVTRGIEALNFASEKPFSRQQPFREGVHVMCPPNLLIQRSYEMGEILGFHQSAQYEGLYEVLWRSRDLSATVSYEREEDLRVFDRGDTPTISSALAAQALTDDPRSPLCAFVRTETPHSRDRDARELTSLCAAILSAEYPLAVHVMGAQWTRRPVVEQLSRRVAVCSQGGLPEEDAMFLRRHGCTPVLVIVDSENNQHLPRDIKDLRAKGWEIIICSDVSMALSDSYVEHAIADLPRLMGEQSGVAVIDFSESTTKPLSAAIEELGTQARQALGDSIQQNVSHIGAQRRALDSLAEMLDGLAETDPTKTIARRPRELHLLRHAVDAIRRGEAEEVLTTIKRDAPQLFDDSCRVQHGVTQTQESWSFRDLVELSAALAKSRLPPNHPAVLLRGITCLDLSPAALAHLLHQGAQIFRHVDQSGVTRSMIISLSPAVTDATRPGLSASLGHDGSVGYIYWMWVDPDGTEDVRAAYTKLLNRVVLEQLAEGATFLFGRVLERNAASIRTVRSIGGFEIIQTRAVIGGEPAVAVGVDLSRDPAEDAKRATSFNPRAVVEEAMNVFTSGLHDRSKDEELRAAQRLRVSATHEFLIHAYSFRSACENVLGLVTNELWWNDGHKMIRQAEDALSRFAPWLTDAQKEDTERALEMCTDDKACEKGKNALRIILNEVIPENLKSILSNHTRLRDKALQFLNMGLEPISPPKQPHNLRQRADTLPIPPRIDVETVHMAFDRLPRGAQRILDSWWNRSHQQFCWVRDSHPNVYGCHRGLRKWIENDIEKNAAFCHAPKAPESNEIEISEACRTHFEQFAQIIEWANQVARAGHFDQHVAAYLFPIIQAFLGRRG